MKNWQKISLISMASLTVLYIAFMGAYFLTSEPEFCTFCHQIDPYVQSWRKAPHSDVKCMYCHEARGILGKMESKARGLNYYYVHMTGQYTIPTRSKIFEQNCIACHLGDYYDYPNTKRMDKEHYNYIKSNQSCLKCHRETGHKNNLFSKEKFLFS